MHLIDWQLTAYDYWTFAFLLVAIIALFYVLIQIGGLPGRIAERRNHPRAEAVKIVGWIGLFTVVPWIHAIIWSIHDGLTIDVRTMPKDGSPGEIERPVPLTFEAKAEPTPTEPPSRDGTGTAV